jgi:magnesium-transporting ATPase (P-type)
MELVMTDDTKRQGAEAEPWHSLEPTEVEERLGGGEHGLGEDEVAERRERYGANRLPAPPARGPLRRFLAQFNNLLIYVLIGAAVVTALLQHWIDTGVILAVVLVNSIIGFIQEGKAEKALEAIRDMLSPHASVIRGGQRLTIPAEELVPGDRVLLEAGDKVPADMRLLRAKGLQVQEAALTGESVPVEKRAEAVDEDTDLGDRFSMAYSGTLVTSGRGTGIVVATGADTQIGRISTMLSEVETLTTPLLKAMNVFARWLTLAIVGFATLVFFFAFVLRDFGAVDSFMASVALAVAAIPEGLPAILTVTLAIGVQRMAGRNAIIRRLPAVETLGSVSIICSDKTGTLTRNEMTVRSIALHQRDYAVSGVGYDPRGRFERDGQEVDPDDDSLLTEALRAMVLCNDATLREDGGEWVVDGDPMEGALLTVGRKGDLDPAFEHQSWTRTDVIPFESEHQFMATLNHDHEGHGRIYVKGAPERLFEMCVSVHTEDGSAPLDRDEWMRRVDELAAQGERVLAVAFRTTESDRAELRFDDVENDLTLLGLFGLIDPPREEAIRAVAECQSAGIRVKMITGDHSGTAQAIGKQLGLERADEVLTGRDLQAMDDAELKRRVVDVDVFARTTPEHKLRLVRALQAHGFVVAMTGDGVNDAPALKQADVGVAMGQNGTETSKEASEMVLADDNFASIANAVREGRTVYDNLKKAITFLLPINGGESGSIIAAIMLGLALPITPLQVLWVNMVSSVGLAMALAFEPAERDIMQRPPRPPGEPILSAFVIWRIVFVSILFLFGIFGMYTWSVAQGFSIEMARTHAVNTLVVMEVFYLFSVRSLRTRTLTVTGIIGTRAVAVAVLVVVSLQLVFTYAPFMQFFFDSRPMGLREGTMILAVGIAVFALLEVEKAVRNRYAAYRHPERPAH